MSDILYDQIEKLRSERDEVVAKLLTTKNELRDITGDRDEWKEQHENLLAMYRESQSKLDGIKKVLAGADDREWSVALLQVAEIVGFEVPK